MHVCWAFDAKDVVMSVAKTVHIKQVAQEDQMSDCRSFGSNYYPSNQSRKISIGVMVDPLLKRRSKVKNNAKSTMRVEEISIPKENNLEGNNRGEGAQASEGANRTEAPAELNSPRSTSRFALQRNKTSEVGHCKQVSNLPGSSGLKHVPPTNSVQPSVNRTSIFQPSDDKQEFGKSNKNKTESPKRVMEFTSGTVPENNEATENNPGKPGNRSTDALRMKLFEILGTVSSPKSQPSNAQAPEVGVDNLKLDQNKEHKGDKVSNPKQNSDTIETDSETPNHAIRRPVTRLSARKRAPAKVGPKKTKFGSSSSYKHFHQEKNIFNFEEGCRGNFDVAVNFSSVVTNHRKSKKKHASTGRRTSSFSRSDDDAEVQKQSQRKETSKPVKNASNEKSDLLSNKKGSTIDTAVKCLSSVGKDKKLPRTSAVAKPHKFCFPELDKAAEVQRTMHTSETPAPVKNVRTEKTSSYSNERGNNLDTALTFSSCLTKHKKIQGKSNVIEPREIFRETDEAAQVRRDTFRGETQVPAKSMGNGQTFSVFNKRGSFGSCSPQRTTLGERQDDSPEKNVHVQQETGKKNQPFTQDNLVVLEDRDRRQSSGNQSMKAPGDPQVDLQSPTFGFKTPTSCPSPIFTPETVWMQHTGHSPAREKTKFTERNMFGFNTLKPLEATNNGSAVERDLSDRSKKLKHHSTREKASSRLYNDSECSLFESPSEGSDANSSGEDSPVIKGHRERDTSLSGISWKSMHVHNIPKSTFYPEAAMNDTGPTFPSPKEINGSYYFQELSGPNEEDGLGRAIMLFAMALQNFERKLKSTVRKKASNILISVSEGIHLELQNAESRIQTDAGKLSSLNRSKRKRLEMKFQEQQEQLRLLHEKIKAEINHNLQDFRGTLEELGADETELKGTLKKQKAVSDKLAPLFAEASHQKLIAQLEGQVEAQLNDAQRRITAVNELAKAQMVQLKRVVAECLKDTIED